MTTPIAQEDLNRDELLAKAVDALAGNKTFLDIASPNNAQVIAQVKALTRQVNGVIRLLTGRFEGTE